MTSTNAAFLYPRRTVTCGNALEGQEETPTRSSEILICIHVYNDSKDKKTEWVQIPVAIGLNSLVLDDMKEHFVSTDLKTTA